MWRIPPLTSGAEDARPSLDYVLQGSEMYSKCTRWKEREVSERDRGRRGWGKLRGKEIIGIRENN